jgi:hypothetical protein
MLLKIHGHARQSLHQQIIHEVLTATGSTSGEQRQAQDQADVALVRRISSVQPGPEIRSLNC